MSIESIESIESREHRIIGAKEHSSMGVKR